ncbi:MAG: SMI1/KNR4 family protein [Anaerolineae bacterium]|nr:SMI1/KNR4 family protein [Anaerolineae bacterium]
MTENEWLEFMIRWNKTILDNVEYLEPIPEHLIEKKWLGNAGATDQEIRQLEARLEKKLPSSYKSFLRVTNGWNGILTNSIYSMDTTISINWFIVRYRNWFDQFILGTEFEEQADNFINNDADHSYGPNQNTHNFSIAHWKRTLAISERGDSAVLLLNPLVVDESGEWEAWHFANWNPGARKFKSFSVMMIELYTMFESDMNYFRSTKNLF